MTTLTAQERRVILANAHAKWIATRMDPNVDAVHNLKLALLEANLVQLTDSIEDVRNHGTTIVITVYTDGEGEFNEMLELDAYGNFIRGI